MDGIDCEITKNALSVFKLTSVSQNSYFVHMLVHIFMVILPV